LFLQLCFFLQSQHISGQGCLQSPCIFTKLQPHQAKTKLVTPSFFTSFCNRNHIAIRGAITLRHDLQSTTFWFATVVFFCNRNTSVVANTLQRMFAITSILGPGCNLASILQCRGTELFLPVFCNRNHIAIRGSHWDMICNQLHSGLQLSFSFAIAAHQSLQTHCKGCCNHQYFWTRLQPSFNLTVSWHGAFFLKLVFFLPVFFWNSFFLQNHCSKVAITLLWGCKQ
jgi:hypothetical protein